MGICQWLAEMDGITYFCCNYEDELQKDLQGVHNILISLKNSKITHNKTLAINSSYR